MERWSGKVAVVTGASTGIGAAIAKELVKSGLTVIGLARRDKKIEELRLHLPINLQHNLYALKCDVSIESEIVETFKKIVDDFGGVDVLVNNAGLIKPGMLTDKDNSEALTYVVNVNLLGLIFCTREAVQSMKNRAVAGHVIHINSIAGHSVPIMHNCPPMLNVYPATKFGVTALTETYRQEFLHAGIKIKITSISPGYVNTEATNEKLEEFANYTNGLPTYIPLEPEDIASAVVYVLGTPPNVQVHELTIKPILEPL